LAHRAALPLLLIISLGLIIWAAGGVRPDAVSVVVAPVLAQETAVQAQSPTLVAAGWVEPHPFPVAVVALVDGFVAQVHVLEGDAVTSGQLLASLVTDDAELELAAAEARLQQAVAESRRAAAVARAARRRWEENIDLPLARTNAGVEAEQALANRRSAENARSAAAAVLKDRDAAFERVRSLRESGSASEAELIAAEADRATAQEAFAAAEREVEVAQAETRRAAAEAFASERRAVLRVDDEFELASSEAMQAAADAGLNVARAEMATAELALSRHQLAAPADGVVLRRFIIPGSKLVRDMDDPNSSLAFELYDPRRLQIRADIPLAESAAIRVGQRAAVTCEATGNRIVEGEVVRIVPRADVQKNTIECKIRLIDPPVDWRPEMLVRIRFGGTQDASEEPLVLLHRDAIAEDGSVVLARGFDGEFATAERRSVTATATTEGATTWLPAKGVLPGDLAVIDAPRGLQPGERLRVQRLQEEGQDAIH
jgi:multidrug efflux pump subunit AcrA (membrane-fusion protein)